jgi:hypothetical protein
MKIVNGKVKLDANDYRVGNFVFHDEEGHVKMMDIGGALSVRVSKAFAKGRMLDMAVKERSEGFLTNVAATTYNFLCTIPDMEFFKAVNDACIACVNRHKDIYGLKDDVTAEEDAEILKEERELHDASDEVAKKVKEGEDKAKEKDAENG